MLFWDILAVVCMALLAGALLYGYAERKKIKWEAFRQDMDEAERAFCEQAEREAGLLKDNAELMLGAAPKGLDGQAALGAIPALISVSAAPSSGPLQGADMQVFADRLRDLLILGALEGRVEMPPPEPPGLIYRLRDGKTALLLDSVPSERFLAHHARRFDYILIRGREGNSFAIQRIEDFITARTAL